VKRLEIKLYEIVLVQDLVDSGHIPCIILLRQMSVGKLGKLNKT